IAESQSWKRADLRANALKATCIARSSDRPVAALVGCPQRRDTSQNARDRGNQNAAVRRAYRHEDQPTPTFPPRGSEVGCAPREAGFRGARLISKGALRLPRYSRTVVFPSLS